ncbi:MAG: glycosyltransferase [Planctomycetota bacterium]
MGIRRKAKAALRRLTSSFKTETTQPAEPPAADSAQTSSETDPKQTELPPEPVLLSVLILSLHNRVERFLTPLLASLQKQVAARRNVEILTLIDNKMFSVGYKRDGLLQMARGQFCCFVDDDDWVSPDYISKILDCIAGQPEADVIVFKQQVVLDGGSPFVVTFGLDYDDEPARQVDGKWIDIKRKPVHLCVWRSELAKAHRFADVSYGEDLHWSTRVLKDVKHLARIDAVLYRYDYDHTTSEARSAPRPAPGDRIGLPR